MKLTKPFYGRICSDIVTTQTQNGSITKFSLVENHKNKNKEDVSTFFNMVAFGKTGEIISQYHNKGDIIYIDCRIENGDYINSDGVKVYGYNFVVSSFQFVPNYTKKTKNSDDDNIEFDVSDIKAKVVLDEDGVPESLDDIPF